MAGRARGAVHRLGRRGAFLIFLAVLDGVYAYGLLIQAPAPASHPSADLLLPVQAWAGLWAATGLACAASSAIRRDRVAYTLAATLKAAWAGTATWQWASGLLPNGWLSGVVWLAFAATVLVIASWPEAAPKVVEPRPPDIMPGGP